MLRRVGALLRRARPAAGPPPGAAVEAYRPIEHDADFLGRLTAEYAPRPDGRPDPGEIVWTWVPFEDDPRRGKDRPVLLVGHDPNSPGHLLGLMLTSQDHDRDAAARASEARRGRHWVDIGSGPWDRQRRPSEVRVDRILRVDPARVRREGATLDRARFDEVVAAVHRLGR